MKITKVSKLIALTIPVCGFAQDSIENIAENWGGLSELVGDSMSEGTQMTCGEFNRLSASQDRDDYAKSASIMTMVFAFLTNSDVSSDQISSLMMLAAINCSTDPEKPFIEAFAAG